MFLLHSYKTMDPNSCISDLFRHVPITQLQNAFLFQKFYFVFRHISVVRLLFSFINNKLFVLHHNTLISLKFLIQRFLYKQNIRDCMSLFKNQIQRTFHILFQIHVLIFRYAYLLHIVN